MKPFSFLIGIAMSIGYISKHYTCIQYDTRVAEHIILLIAK